MHDEVRNQDYELFSDGISCRGQCMLLVLEIRTTDSQLIALFSGAINLVSECMARLQIRTTITIQ